jgi:hypothetical protein
MDEISEIRRKNYLCLPVVVVPMYNSFEYYAQINTELKEMPIERGVYGVVKFNSDNNGSRLMRDIRAQWKDIILDRMDTDTADLRIQISQDHEL